MTEIECQQQQETVSDILSAIRGSGFYMEKERNLDKNAFYVRVNYMEFDADNTYMPLRENKNAFYNTYNSGNDSLGNANNRWTYQDADDLTVCIIHSRL